MQITGSPKGQGFTFLQAYYNDVAGAPIAVGHVPEIDPAAAGSVFSLVMGSLAMLERRRKRRETAPSASTAST
jgi:hypothetical protein